MIATPTPEPSTPRLCARPGRAGRGAGPLHRPWTRPVERGLKATPGLPASVVERARREFRRPGRGAAARRRPGLPRRRESANRLAQPSVVSTMTLDVPRPACARARSAAIELAVAAVPGRDGAGTAVAANSASRGGQCVEPFRRVPDDPNGSRGAKRLPAAQPVPIAAYTAVETALYRPSRPCHYRVAGTNRHSVCHSEQLSPTLRKSGGYRRLAGELQNWQSTCRISLGGDAFVIALAGRCSLSRPYSTILRYSVPRLISST